MKLATYSLEIAATHINCLDFIWKLTEREGLHLS